VTESAASPPSVVFGMTLYNNARHLPEAIESLLAQSDPGFGLLLMDDGSSDETEAIARGYVARDGRLRYVRHAERQGMVAAWRDAFECATAEWPGAAYFAWASDHDRWDPGWLAVLRRELDDHPEAVLAYGLVRRIDEHGVLLDKPPRTFDTAGLSDPAARVLKVAGEAAGAGDMVYGLMRAGAVRRAGIFRPVIQPDRLLITELALAGQFRQIPQVLWFRRHAAEASVVRQRHTLFTAATAPDGLGAAHWRQHARALVREYVHTPPPGLDPTGMRRLVRQYQFRSIVRHYSKSDAILHRAGEALEAVNQSWKGVKHVWRHFAYNTLVFGHRAAERIDRAARRTVYRVLVLTHRLGLRGPRDELR